MSLEVSNAVEQMISHRMATGIYASEEQLLIIALNKLDDYEQSVADIKKGLEDELAGRVRSLKDADRSLRQELGFLS